MKKRISMKNIITFLLVFSATIFNCPVSIAQLKGDGWASQAGGELVDHGTALVTDKAGNIYITGGFQSSSNFGSNHLEASGDTDIFLTRYDKSGNVAWSVRAGSDTLLNSSLSEYGNDVLIANDFIYVTGVFMSTANFHDRRVKSHGMEDIFLAKYTMTGELVWVRSAGGESQDIAYSLSADLSGNIYVAGSFQREAHFGVKTITAMNSTEMFLAKYNQEGDLVWIRQSKSELSGAGRKVKCADNYCLVAGEFEGAVTFGSDAIQNHDTKILLTKYHTNGDVAWVKTVASEGKASVEDLLVKEDHIYLTGSFFDKFNFAGKEFYSKGSKDAYIVKLNKNGVGLWGTSVGGAYMDTGASLTTNDEGEIFVAGNFQQTLDLGKAILHGHGADDVFIVSFKKDGEINRVESFGGSGQDQVQDISIIDKSICITGHYRDSIDIRGDKLTSKGSSDIMLARIDILNEDLNKEYQANIVILYPNPSKGSFNMESLASIKWVKFYNVHGQRLTSVELNPISEHLLEVKFKENFSGICFAETFVNGKIVVTKVIIE
jgi:hypothetical protein